jgi:hypothetical protein
MPGLTLSFQIERNVLDALNESVTAELSKVVRETAAAVESNAVLLLNEDHGSGRIYSRGGESTVTFYAGQSGDDGPAAGREKMVTFNKGRKGVEHQASAPGEAPHTDLGHLANSIQVVETGALSAEVQVGSEYGAALEFGTVDGRIAARPFLTPAMEAQAEPFRERCETALRTAIEEQR